MPRGELCYCSFFAVGVLSFLVEEKFIIAFFREGRPSSILFPTRFSIQPLLRCCPSSEHWHLCLRDWGISVYLARRFILLISSPEVHKNPHYPHTASFSSC